MQLTPSAAYQHIMESVAQYVETAYKIGQPLVFEERRSILRQLGTIAQQPFVESTPAFPAADMLADLERRHPGVIPSGLSDLVGFGVPVNSRPLYSHQRDALLAAFGAAPDLLVATGTGSGKTEAFLLPILADILREAADWPETAGQPQSGQYDAQANTWLSSRRHERRPAALRAVVLYPMNALVNDQLARLRRILALGESPRWQIEHLRGNLIRFGMYTSLAQPTGSWEEESRRRRFADFLQRLAKDWDELRDDLKQTGFWPRPDGSEMLCRWDMQAAPPDILVTNYSMLEYMLTRPIENLIFDKTKRWLEETPDARFTLVLDEAHTYSGARGTEVAYLVRRLKERLGIAQGVAGFRAIATTASLPNEPSAGSDLLHFMSDLFDEPQSRFTLVRTGVQAEAVPESAAEPQAMAAFAGFHSRFRVDNPGPAIEALATDLALDIPDPLLTPAVALHALLEKNAQVAWVRARTARNATPLGVVSGELWQGLGSPDVQERATAGVLAAGSFARSSDRPDTQPLLSIRLHAFFRGVPGIWACMNPDCPEVPDAFTEPGRSRPVGKLYTEPRSWCSDRCGSRVLELFSCRRCGLLFLGGIPDERLHSLWPWSDDLSGERQDIGQFRVFCVERPHHAADPEYRSIRTTLPAERGDEQARDVYEVERAQDDDGQPLSNFPARCPRCQNSRQPGAGGREIIEPLRTRGPRAFSVMVEDAFRVQPRATRGERPNYGRKALLFTDSRMEAAVLAADLRNDHHSDLFRQLLYRALHLCRTCRGTGAVDESGPYVIGEARRVMQVTCPACVGHGADPAPLPLSYTALRAEVIDTQNALGIDPTNGEEPGYFHRLSEDPVSAHEDAVMRFNVALRRELAEDEFGLEPLGLARWVAELPEHTGSFRGMSEQETRVFLGAVARILATENVLLPPSPQMPWDWPQQLVAPYERQELIRARAGRRSGGRRAVPYNLSERRKLGRYARAVARALVAAGRLTEDAFESWLSDLEDALWDALTNFGILVPAGSRIDGRQPFGIRIDSFDLYAVGEVVYKCQACAYVMADTVLGVCVRCGDATSAVSAADVRNYYRLAADYALPTSHFDDPHPLRAIEHTAQIPGAEARDIERWFQDLFHDDQNPYDYRVDVLSVTTTMEMGIDIGSLLTVGLRNVPPTVSNYQQRAGRAGRRGSSIATVLTFSQFRSHDQYYFSSPPEIVSDAPRIPTLHLANSVIARRHMRALVLQAFFHRQPGQHRARGLFASWGTVEDFATHQLADRLRQHLATNREPLLARCRQVLPPALAGPAEAWFGALVAEIQEAVGRQLPETDLLEALISSGLLPKYAFPIDVVSLDIPNLPNLSLGTEDVERPQDTGMERDLKIALAEYAPEAEVIRGTFPSTYVYRSAGVYDRFATKPDYSATGTMIECQDCQSVQLIRTGDDPPCHCGECESLNVLALPFLRPPGFTVDAALPDAGRETYKGGRERAGYAAAARLLVGESSFTSGRQCVPFARNLYTHVRVGELFMCNKGPDPNRLPGFLICSTCGRALDLDEAGVHPYPASVPPHRGRNRGPRAGDYCQNTQDFRNRVVLGHPFTSEVILLGVDLDDDVDAPLGEASGKAVWYSFGTLMANAASRVLQIAPGELKIGVRAVRRSTGRVHGEVFVYDDVPGGAGYARAVDAELPGILQKALDLGMECRNPSCAGACYSCLYEYGNQMVHPLLDRRLGVSVLQYLLDGRRPALSRDEADAAAASLADFVRADCTVGSSLELGGQYFPCTLEGSGGWRRALRVIHPLQGRSVEPEVMASLASRGMLCFIATDFDLRRRPFWVSNNLTAV